MPPLLRTGSKGPDVAALRKALNKAGRSTFPQLGTDGHIGPKTYSRVTEFQRDNRLAADGVVRSQTWGALQEFMDAVKGFMEQVGPPPSEAAALFSAFASPIWDKVT